MPDFLGLQTLYNRYFLHHDDVRFELPQAFFVRVAMCVAVQEIDRETRAIEFSELLSRFDVMASTPTLFNSGTTRPQLSSCFLTTVDNDLDAIFQAYRNKRGRGSRHRPLPRGRVVEPVRVATGPPTGLRHQIAGRDTDRERPRNRPTHRMGAPSPGEFVAILVPQRPRRDQRVSMSGTGEPQHAETGLSSMKYSPAATTAFGQAAGIPPLSGSTWPPHDARCGSNTPLADVSPGPAAAPWPHLPRPPPRGHELQPRVAAQPDVRRTPPTSPPVPQSTPPAADPGHRRSRRPHAAPEQPAPTPPAPAQAGPRRRADRWTGTESGRSRR